MGYQNFYATKLSNDIGASDTSIVVDQAPTETSGRLVLEARNPTQREIIKYLGVSGNTLTGVTRGQGGTSAKPHIKSTLVEMNATAEDLSEALGLSFAFPTGIVMPYAGSITPSGWLSADGSAVSRTTYASLFTAIGTNFGAGDGSTTFNLPDMRSRMPIGAGSAPSVVATFSSRASNVITVTGLSNVSDNEFQTGQAVLFNTTGTVIGGLTNNTTYYLIRTGNLTFSLATSRANAVSGTAITLSSDGTGTRTFTLNLTARTLASKGGEESHTLTASQTPVHNHGLPEGRNSGVLNNPGQWILQGWTSTGGGATAPSVGTGDSGGSSDHNIQSPYIALNYIIKT